MRDGIHTLLPRQFDRSLSQRSKRMPSDFLRRESDSSGVGTRAEEPCYFLSILFRTFRPTFTRSGVNSVSKLFCT